MSAPLRLALLSHHASPVAPTGAERSLALLAEGFRGRGHRVSIAVPGEWALADRVRGAGVEVATVPSRACWMTYWEPRPWPIAALKWLRWALPDGSGRRLRRWLESVSPDVVHVNCLPHVTGARAASAVGRPVVWHLREILPAGPRRRWFARVLRRDAAAVVAVSEAVAAWVRAEGLDDRLHVVPNGVAVGRSAAGSRASSREALGLPADAVVAGLFGQIVPHKGALEFVAAASRAARRVADLHAVVAGDGPAEFVARVRGAAEEAGLGARFRLLPPQPTGERLVAAADVVCLCTTTPDPFPRAVLEAMASGRAVAAFRSGGTPEMVRDGVEGRLVEPGDVGKLAEALIELSSDRALRDRMGAAGRKRAEEHFHMDRHLDRMERVFREVASR